MRLLAKWFILSIALLLAGCNLSQPTSQLEQIRARGELRVGTVYGPTSYYQRDNTDQGYDYELAKAYADWLGVKLSMRPMESASAIQQGLSNGDLDLAAGAIAITPERRKGMRFGPGYYQVSPKLVYRQGTKKPKSFADLNGKLVIAAGSASEEQLLRLKERYPNLTWEMNKLADHEELLRQVAEGKIDYTIVHDTVLARIQRYYPDLAEGLTLENDYQVGWAMAKLPDDTLYASVIDFFGQRFLDGTIAQLDEKYFGHVQNFDFVDTRTFLKRAKTLLPKYQPLFKEHAGKLDWRLLAALSYQESHWNPDARSYTGVRGMMMLTENTAKSLGVKDRTHPAESIAGGARYLHQLIEQVPDSVPEDEKFWFALTAYNIGYGHMMDARRLAKMQGKNPDSWSDVKDVLPLLQESRWHRKVRYGYARGGEARNYVNNVRQYYQSLLWLDNEQQKLRQRESLLEQDEALAAEPVKAAPATSTLLTALSS
ncbi:membrane-bound lytic transglycosylase F [Aeromonas diversa CDC 2478-85]|uniref:Membrane-bound lytic murein transglycosylase F n=1 Tax=Aeromonas diversa CDC 2478-85 TaxID=1268237 RepID=N9VP18_9GAMM|nr:membrane-bound lytic murein transglycosylase MltF [Aeromonas diversa]ENY73298.1 membrane-bound lytic transglycosylase F [Aeromonas diversa CDC 2478-85]